MFPSRFGREKSGGFVKKLALNAKNAAGDRYTIRGTDLVATDW